MTPLAISVTAALAKRFEGCFLSPYLCPAGVPTIGLGATYYEDGTVVTLRDPAIAQERAIALLAWMLEKVYLPQVMRLCPGVTNPYLLGALVDFTFNLGAGALKNSTLRRKVNAEEWGACPAEFRKWCKAGGRTLRGLSLRREAEITVSFQGATLRVG